LFARRLPFELVFAIWDSLFFSGDPFLHYFFALSLLIRNEESILSMESTELPALLCNLQTTLKTTADVRACFDLVTLPLRDNAFALMHSARRHSL
jgi:hypothetical protein